MFYDYHWHFKIHVSGSHSLSNADTTWAGNKKLCPFIIQLSGDYWGGFNSVASQICGGQDRWFTGNSSKESDILVGQSVGQH